MGNKSKSARSCFGCSSFCPVFAGREGGTFRSEDPLPDETAPGNWVARYELDNYEVTSVSLAAGESASLKFNVTIVSPAKSGSSYTVTAKATSTGNSSIKTSGSSRLP